MLRSFFVAVVACWTASIATAHEGPDPLARWEMTAANVSDGKLKAILGPSGKLATKSKIVGGDAGDYLALSGDATGCTLADNFRDVAAFLPTRAFTVEALVAVQAPLRYGGIVGALQDNGSKESGWLLGYNESVFSIALATKGADDGDGKLTYVKGQTKYVPGKFYHVVATYDGNLLELYVNGKLENSSKDQSGEILYPQATPFVIGGYHDDNEDFPMTGSIREISVYNVAARQKWVEHAFSHVAEVASTAALPTSQAFEFVVVPYLQFGTTSGMTVMWQSSQTGIGTLKYGPTVACEQTLSATTPASLMHELRVEGLEPGTQYFYRTSTTSESGGLLESEPSTFQTAVKPGIPFAFAVMSDTQGNPRVSGILANAAWEQRPHFVLHSGDLVQEGPEDHRWTKEFFPGMQPLISRVPFYSVLGNHERNAGQYYKYVSVPAPEYYYTYHYGDSQFFMIDSNKNVGTGSEQYKWLEKELSASPARWKFVCHHHPPYSSDENDFGDLWKTNKSTHGDVRVRQLVPLYEKYGVDIVWSGHIHSYERTWPVLENKTVQKAAPVYLVTGGAGGHLESPGPTRPFFQNNVRRVHHYAMVYVNQGRLEFKAFDLEGRLFDVLTIEK